MSHNRLVVHCKRENFDVYVGRPARPTPHHYGNPFSNRGGTLAALVVDDPVQAFDAWLSGTYRPDLEPERRRWILDNLTNLAGKRLGCWCVTPDNPEADCHGWVLARRALEGASPVVAYYDTPGPAPEPAAPARATDRTDVKGTSWLERDGQRVPIVMTLGEDLTESMRLSARLAELRQAARNR